MLRVNGLTLIEQKNHISDGERFRQKAFGRSSDS